MALPSWGFGAHGVTQRLTLSTSPSRGTCLSLPVSPILSMPAPKSMSIEMLQFKRVSQAGHMCLRAPHSCPVKKSEVWTGDSSDIIPHLLETYGPRSVDMVFMDQKGPPHSISHTGQEARLRTHPVPEWPTERGRYSIPQRFGPHAGPSAFPFALFGRLGG